MEKFNVYEAVTARIIEQLEAGIIPWDKPWTGTPNGAISGVTGKPYSLLNQMLLEKPGEYFTFKQVKERGGSVRKGEKSSLIVFWKQAKVEELDENGQTKEKLVPMLRFFNVFNIDQCNNLKARHITQEPPVSVEDGEIIISNYSGREGITIQHIKGDKASYSPTLDKITLPLREQFTDAAEYYSTAFHEMTHSTGHSKRLNRIKATAHFGNADYSREELVAEIGAAALMNKTGIETKRSFRNSSAYVQGWLQVLNNDHRMIALASAQAAKAVDYILQEL